MAVIRMFLDVTGFMLVAELIVYRVSWLVRCHFTIIVDYSWYNDLDRCVFSDDQASPKFILADIIYLYFITFITNTLW